jgi:aminopeptidase 2
MCQGHDASGSTLAAGREILPANVKPIHYDLTLTPDFKTFKFDGAVEIE